jgi:hypothetical protein
MTSQTSKNSPSWRRVVSGGAVVGTLAAGLLTGLGVTTALADPDDSAAETQAPVAAGPPTPCTGADCNRADEETPATPTMTADQALQIIATEYDTGAGGGQISNLIHDILTLRAQGFKPSNANKLAIQEALEHRPNQAPLLEALKATLAYQRKLQAQAQNSVQGPAPAQIAVGPTPGPLPPGGAQPGPSVGVTGPGAGITMPIG